ncbi:hypothetical protein ACGFOU_12955 [Streptomyces sp. NPDC048595]|uniref:hypothetical protein n=1 Tax=Streptomyces sp. NPDC048595 TaxID=3365576 RepID=UPI003711EB24
MMKAKRAFAAAVVTAAAFAVPAAMAGPAAADSTRPIAASKSASTVHAMDSGDCVAALARDGYNIGPKARKACGYAGPAHGVPGPLCLSGLFAIGVRTADAGEACALVW